MWTDDNNNNKGFGMERGSEILIKEWKDICPAD